jgi:hypothetical protein
MVVFPCLKSVILDETLFGTIERSRGGETAKGTTSRLSLLHELKRALVQYESLILSMILYYSPTDSSCIFFSNEPCQCEVLHSNLLGSIP